MRAAFLVAVSLAAAACGANATVLSPPQELYLLKHPELGPRDRNAILYRTIAVGDSLERVHAAWDGLLFRRQEPNTPDVIGGAVAVRREATDRYEVFIPVDGRPVVVKTGYTEEEIPRGRVILTFQDGRLLSYARFE